MGKPESDNTTTEHETVFDTAQVNAIRDIVRTEISEQLGKAVGHDEMETLLDDQYNKITRYFDERINDYLPTAQINARFDEQGKSFETRWADWETAAIGVLQHQLQPVLGQLAQVTKVVEAYQQTNRAMIDDVRGDIARIDKRSDRLETRQDDLEDETGKRFETLRADMDAERLFMSDVSQRMALSQQASDTIKDMVAALVEWKDAFTAQFQALIWLSVLFKAVWTYRVPVPIVQWHIPVGASFIIMFLLSASIGAVTFALYTLPALFASLGG